MVKSVSLLKKWTGKDSGKASKAQQDVLQKGRDILMLYQGERVSADCMKQFVDDMKAAGLLKEQSNSTKVIQDPEVSEIFKAMIVSHKNAALQAKNLSSYLKPMEEILKVATYKGADTMASILKNDIAEKEQKARVNHNVIHVPDWPQAEAA